MPLSDLIRRPWFAPALVLGLGLVAAIGNAAAGFGGACAACRQDLVIYVLGLPIVLASLLAAVLGAATMIVRRSLLLAGLIFGVTIYLNVGRARAAWFGNADVPAGSDDFWIGWNLALPAAMLAVAMWGVFAPAPATATRR